MPPGHATFVAPGTAESRLGAPRPAGNVTSVMDLAPCARSDSVTAKVLTGVLLAAAVGTAALAMTATGSAKPGHGTAGIVVTWLVLILQLLVSGLMLQYRRKAPLGLAVAITGTAVVAELAAIAHLYNAPDVWEPLALTFAMENLTATGRRRLAGPVAWLLIGVVTVLAVRPWQPELIGLLRTLLPALAGLYLGSYRWLTETLRDRAERAEREQQLVAEQARGQERTRLAAEMHDVVSHSVTLMVLQAGALGVTARDGATRAAAEELRTTGCQALGELRELIGVLRNGQPGQPGVRPASAPPPGARPAEIIPGLLALVAESESVGVPVELDQRGEPGPVSPAAARAAYRVLQEALTNVRKHAPGARVRMQVAVGPDGISLDVRNGAAAAPADAELAATGSGSGLDGVRERVRLLGGRLAAGPAGDGGFQVSAVLRWPRRTAGRRRRAARPARRQPGARGGAVIRVLIADDEPMVCAHLRTILSSADDIEVVDVAPDGAAAVEAVVRYRPDVVLMDLRMPGVDGLTATSRIAELTRPPAVVVLTTFDADDYVLRALRAGAAASWSSRRRRRT